MTVSSTHCSSALERALGAALQRWRRWRIAALVALALAALPLAGTAAPEGAEVRDVRIEQTDDGIMLESNMSIELTVRLEEAVSRGVPLYFIVEYELYRARWYWWDEKASSGSRTYRLTYNALTRQYRLSSGLLGQTFEGIDEVERFLSRVTSRRIAGRADLTKGTRYEAAVRLRLDVNALPKPIQMNALASREWSLQSEWYRWSFTP